MRLPSSGTARAWKRSLAELTLIVIGVLVALAVNSWWDGRTDRRREEAYLQQLLSDMRENERRIRKEIANDSRRLASIQGFLDLAFTDTNPTSVESRPGTSVFRPVTGTYAALVQSGNLYLVRNEAIRFELISWATQLASVQEHLRLYAMRTWQHAERVALAEVLHLRPSADERETSPWGSREADPQAMLNDPEVVAAMALERGLHRNRMALLQELEDPTHTLICLLQAELEPIEAVALQPSSASTAIAETTRLEASVHFSNGLVLDGCPVSWESNDEDVASVEHGEVTGVADGDVTITATFDGVSSSAHITIEADSQ